VNAFDHRDRLGGVCVRIAAFCVGMAGSLHLLGVAGLYRSILDPLPRTTILAVVIALLAAASAPGLPHQVAVRWFRRKTRGPHPAWDSVRSGLLSPDLGSARQGLLWVTSAVILVAAGLAALILLWATGPVELAHRWLLETCLLSRAEVFAADAVAVGVPLVVPWMAIGLAVACLEALSAGYESPGRVGAGAFASIVLGVAVGSSLAQTDLFMASPALTALAGTVPLFVAAVLAVVRAGRRHPLDASVDPFEGQLPQVAPEAGHVLLTTLVVWGAIVAVNVAIWPRVVAAGLNAAWSIESWLVPWQFATLTAGIFLGGRWARRRGQPAGGCGLAMVTAGAAMGAGITGCSLLGGAGQASGSGGSVVAAVVVLASVAMPALTLGGAFPYLQRAVLVQSGSPTLACAQVVAAVLIGAVLGTVASMAWIVPEAGTLVSLGGASLLALATGGLLVIFDVGSPAGHRRWRLTFVFASLLGMMVGLPAAGQQWLRWGGDVTAFREGLWLTALQVRGERVPRIVVGSTKGLRPSRDMDPARMSQAIHAVIRLRGPVQRTWFITTGGLQPDPIDAPLCGQIDTSPYDLVAAQIFPERLAGAEPRRPGPVSADPALLALRCAGAPYDLIIIESIPGGGANNHAVWALETLQRARRRLAPHGLLAAMVRPADCGRSEFATLVATFADVMGDSARACTVGSDADLVFTLLGTADQGPVFNWDAATAAGMTRSGTLRGFLKSVHRVLPNSLRNPLIFQPDGTPGGSLPLVQYVIQTADWHPLLATPRPTPVQPPVLAPPPASGPAPGTSSQSKPDKIGSPTPVRPDA
jgi:hypothetical protein